MSPGSSVKQITPAVGDYDGLAIMPEERLVYSVGHARGVDLWTRDIHTGSTKQLTSALGRNVYPSVTADGRYIVFASNHDGRDEIWRMDAEGGDPTRLTAGYFPDASPDGRWVVYQSQIGNRWALWRMPLQGGASQRLTEENELFDAQRPVVSPDSRLVACEFKDARRGRKGIAIIPIDGGPPVKTLGLQPRWNLIRWAGDGQAIAYTSRANEISILPLSGGSPRKLLSDADDITIFWFDLALDGSRIVYSAGRNVSELILVRGFERP
jgi:hypothetical protein